MLVNFLKEVLDVCHNAGLEVVATVCDTGANNVKALKRLGVSEKTPFFRFRDQELAAVFDPPHLLKCTRNLFLKHNVGNEECVITVTGERLTGTAKWEDILKLYEVEKRNVYRLLPKVTERHIKPSGQDKMKVSWAAQVMSSTVAAVINTLVTVDKDNCTEFECHIGLTVVMLCGATVLVLIFFYGSLQFNMCGSDHKIYIYIENGLFPLFF
jgi:hypothetical protein